MILVVLIAVLIAGGLAAGLAGTRSSRWPRWISVGSTALDLAILTVWYVASGDDGSGRWLAEIRVPWIPAFGIHLHLGMDTLSFILLELTYFLGLLAAAASWSEVRRRSGFFHLNLLWVLGGISGVFVALDLFLFYFFWEVMLVPMVLLIGIWGHERRTYAAIKFFLFTQASGLLMFVSIVALFFVTGSFDYEEILAAGVPEEASVWIMLGFIAAFVVKLPAIPFHTWLPDAHTEAPTAGSVILAGLLLKTGAYGLIRFVVPLFPDDAFAAGVWLVPIGVAGIVYGALLAFAQRDLKRLVAYSSVSHMGFVLLGIFTWNDLALQGVVLEIVCHGLSTGGLFILAGSLQERLHTRDMERMGGLWSPLRRMGALGLILAMASLGLPGLGNFVAEFLVLLGAWREGVETGSTVLLVSTVVATAGLVPAAVYSLWLVQQTFHGPGRSPVRPSDLAPREVAIGWALVGGLVVLGVYPRPVTETVRPAIEALEQVTAEER